MLKEDVMKFRNPTKADIYFRIDVGNPKLGLNDWRTVRSGATITVEDSQKYADQAKKLGLVPVEKPTAETSTIGAKTVETKKVKK